MASIYIDLEKVWENFKLSCAGFIKLVPLLLFSSPYVFQVEFDIPVNFYFGDTIMGPDGYEAQYLCLGYFVTLNNKKDELD